MVDKDLLTEAETTELAGALWTAEYVRADSLPTGTSLFDFKFLDLPEPELGLADRQFRRRWLACDAVVSRHDGLRSGGTISVDIGSSPDNPTQLEDTLWQLGSAITVLRARGSSFDLTDAEREHVVKLLSQWANSPVASYPDSAIQSEIQRYSLWALEGMVSILSLVEIPASIGEAIFQKLKTLTESGTPAFGPIGHLLRVIPDRRFELASWLRTGLASGSPEMACGALLGLAAWMDASDNSASEVDGPPENIMRELGSVIAARRRESLSAALQVAKQVFDDGSDDQRNVILNDTLEGLDCLAEELQYDVEHDDSEIPNLRWRCALLASSMSRAGLSFEPAVVRWLELAAYDPFSEVRNVPLDDSRESLGAGDFQ